MRTRWRPRSRSPSMNQPSPPHAARGFERLPRLAGAPPAALRVVEAGEGVEHGVEVGRDVQPEHLEVVADVADHRQLTRARARRGGPPRAWRRPTPPESRTIFTRGGRRAARACAGRRPADARSRSPSVSTSSREVRRSRSSSRARAPRMGAEAGGAARAVERPEHLGERKRERVRRPVARRHERRAASARAGTRARRVGRADARQIGVDDEARAVDVRASAARTAAPWPSPGSATTSTPSSRGTTAAAASSVTRRTWPTCAAAASSTSPSIASATSARTRPAGGSCRRRGRGRRRSASRSLRQAYAVGRTAGALLEAPGPEVAHS